MTTKNDRQEIVQTFGIRSCYGSDRLMSVIRKFTSTHTPLLVYRDDGMFEGILTLDAALLAHKHNPSTLVRTLVVSPPEISSDAPLVEIIRLMRDTHLYTLPILDSKRKVIGLANAKTMLKRIIQNQHLAMTLVEKMSIRSVITVPEDETVGYAFQLFTKHNISRLIVVDKNNKTRGVVTKRDILLSFFSPTSRQRFSTRSSPKNYSFDTEQLKRNKGKLSSFISPLSGKPHESVNGLSIVQAVLNHKHNFIVVVDENDHPQALYSMRNILDTVVKIVARAPYLLTIISKLPDEISATEKEMVSKEILKIAAWINKQQPVKLVHFSNNVVHTKEHRVTQFEARLTIKTNSTYYAKHKDRDFIRATKEALREIKRQISTSGKKDHSQ